ncbi:uncharacterized protein [Diadema antillarum]|uniref:uncharacterized protein n=1 Tax=Diadema antillarum TaxID=105358 RepID=UPI003A8B7A54
MQPPPRKAKIGQDLKNVQHEQWTKLQSKHQADTDILDDVREFSKQRAAIERIYAQSLTKLASQFLQKRDFPPPSEETEEEQHNRTVWEVWKSLLEETEKNARARLTAAETISTQITDSVKLQKNSRANKLKRCGDLASVWHEEVQASVRDLIKARKNYADAEKIAQDARAKAAEAENRLNKGSTKFFQSRSSLEKTTAKLVSRRKTCDRRSAHMRNEYLLCVAAANAHRKRLFETDVPYVMEALDGDFYDRLRNYFRVFSTTEIETSTYVKSRFQKVSDEAEWVSREKNTREVTRCYHHQKFLDENAIFTDLIQYVYDPVENDEVASLVMDSTESLYLEREARRWATQVAKESNRIETLARRMDECQPYVNQLRGSDNSSDSGFSQDKDPETKLDTLREERRIAETNKLKAEAKLDVMRNAGIDVEEWLNSAYEAMAKEAEIEAQTQLQQQHNLQHQQHRLEEQQHYESSQNMDDEVVEEQGHAPHVRELHSDSITSFDSVDDFVPAYEDQTSQGSSGQVKCTAIFDYTAQRDDELTIREKDVLELIEESEGDGWVKARNQRGEVGYVPENYIEVEKLRLSFSSSPRGDGSISQQGGVLGHGSSQSSVDYEVQAVMATQGVEEDSGEPGICMVRALYDYTGSCKEELSFEEGTIFKLLRRDENGVDDGYWEGELCGRIGVFPSLLVEELVSDSRQGSSDLKHKSKSKPRINPYQFKRVPSIVVNDSHCCSRGGHVCPSEEDLKNSSKTRSSNRPPPQTRRAPPRSSPRHPGPSHKTRRNSLGRLPKGCKRPVPKRSPKKGASSSHNTCCSSSTLCRADVHAGQSCNFTPFLTPGKQSGKSHTLTRSKNCWDCNDNSLCYCKPQAPTVLPTRRSPVQNPVFSRQLSDGDCKTLPDDLMSELKLTSILKKSSSKQNCRDGESSSKLGKSKSVVLCVGQAPEEKPSVACLNRRKEINDPNQDELNNLDKNYSKDIKSLKKALTNEVNRTSKAQISVTDKKEEEKKGRSSSSHDSGLGLPEDDSNGTKAISNFLSGREGRKLSASFNNGRPSQTVKSLLEQKRSTSIPDLSLVEGMYSTRIAPPVNPRTDSLCKGPSVASTHPKSSENSGEETSSPLRMSAETKLVHKESQQESSPAEKPSHAQAAIQKDESSKTKSQSITNQYAKVARNRDDKQVSKQRNAKTEDNSSLKPDYTIPLSLIDRRAVSLDDASPTQENLWNEEGPSNHDRKTSCPTASLIFQQKQKAQNPPNYRKASCPNPLSGNNARRISSRVISPTLERHLRNLNSFWSQNRASVIVNNSQDQDSSSTSLAPPQGTKPRSLSLRANTLQAHNREKSSRSRSCSPARNRQSAPSSSLGALLNVKAPPATQDAPSSTTNVIPIPSTTASTTTTTISNATTSTSPTSNFSSSPGNSPRLSRKQAR